jgi:hypothetical protein
MQLGKLGQGVEIPNSRSLKIKRAVIYQLSADTGSRRDFGVLVKRADVLGGTVVPCIHHPRIFGLTPIDLNALHYDRLV